MKRIFIPNLETNIIKLDSDNIHYLTKTLRLKSPTEILVFNGEKEYLAIFDPTNNNITLQHFIRDKEKLTLKLAVGEIKKERLEWLVEKATELGAIEITILKTERSQNHKNNITRLKKISISACQQCYRVSIPTIEYSHLDTFLHKIDPTEWSFASLNASFSIKPKNGIIIGPEGGWSTEEEESLISHKIAGIKLHQLTLRTETAAIAGLSNLSVDN